MIEVEKKVDIPEEISITIKKDGIYIGSETNRDIYLDYQNFSLMKNDMWLRCRNGEFQLKISKNETKGKRFADIYEEIEGEEKICEFLGLQNISCSRFIETANLITHRESYRFDDITVVFDCISSENDDFKYCTAEIEIMAKNENDIIGEQKKIETFLNKYQIQDKSITPKIIQYFKEKRSEIYDIIRNPLS